MAESQSSPAGKTAFKLLERLRDEVPEVVETHIFSKLNTASKRMLTCTDRRWRTRTVSFYERLQIRDPEVDLRLKVYMFCGSVQLIAWAKQKGCPWDEKTCATIATIGNIDVLKWAREHGCPWNYKTCTEAATEGHVEMLQWLCDNDCKLDTIGPDAPQLAHMPHTCGSHSQREGGQFSYDAFDGAAKNGHLNVLRWALQAGACKAYFERTCKNAAAGGHLEILQWARERDYPWDYTTCAAAARGGHLKTLQWAREHGCPWNRDTCADAAFGGHVNVLRWARGQEPPCPWDAKTCSRAAEGGQLDALKWSRSQRLPCPWDRSACGHAAQKGHLEILKWLRKHHCPWDQSTCDRAAFGGILEMLNWADLYGCPFDGLHVLCPNVICGCFHIPYVTVIVSPWIVPPNIKNPLTFFQTRILSTGFWALR
jgi:hypothetical protein